MPGHNTLQLPLQPFLSHCEPLPNPLQSLTRLGLNDPKADTTFNLFLYLVQFQQRGSISSNTRRILFFGSHILAQLTAAVQKSNDGCEILLIVEIPGTH
ncbi:hypothetical protein D3C75_777630 [compost metagenome]